jgi:hypothetical protein
MLYSDQQALNLLLCSDVYREITYFASSEAGWACQAGSTADPDLLEKVRPHLTCPSPLFDGEFVRTAAGEIFTLVHQYNRVPEWDSVFKKKYGVSPVRYESPTCGARPADPGSAQPAWARNLFARLPEPAKSVLRTMYRHDSQRGNKH